MSRHDRWKQLLSARRIGREEPQGTHDPARSDYERDYDRLVFSSAFRRLQDKTQVFPLSRNDFTRTRLTHSIEVSVVGRTLGRRIQAHEGLPPELDVGSIVAAACLAHDIGNPPFGHSGEDAIQNWAKNNVTITGDKEGRLCSLDTNQQVSDLHRFEGNAQGIRVLTRLQAGRRRGGLQLTIATIGAMMKYPCGSLISGSFGKSYRVEQKKFGYFTDDEALLVPCLTELGMQEYAPGAFRRHPLAFLVEAADDICYAIVDLEDSVDQCVVRRQDACEALTPLAEMNPDFKHKSKQRSYRGKSRLYWLRAYAIQALIDECCSVFNSNTDSILAGDFSQSLIAASKLTQAYGLIQDLVRSHAYTDDRVLAVEVAGFKVIGGLLDVFVPALLNPDESFHAKLLQSFPMSYLGHFGKRTDRRRELSKLTTYQRVLAATDYVSGMTDSFAVNLFQNLSGIRLPE